MNKTMLTLALSAFLALAAGQATAQEQGGVSVGRDVNIKAKTGDINTSSSGKNSKAETNIASVTGHNTKVGRDVRIDAKTGNVNTKADGKNAAACTNVGMVGTSSCQKK